METSALFPTEALEKVLGRVVFMVYPLRTGLKSLKPRPQGRASIEGLRHPSPAAWAFCQLGDPEEEQKASM